MNGKNLFLGMNYVNTKFVEEAETVTQLQGVRKGLSLRRTVVLAAVIGLMLLLLGCGIYALVSMQVKEVELYSDQGELVQAEEIHFEKTKDVFIELGAYYPQQIPEGYTMTFVSEGAPLQHQRITYENGAGKWLDFTIMLGDPASNVEIYGVDSKTEVDINGNPGILYEQPDGLCLVWIDEAQGYGFVLSTDDVSLDLLSVALATAPGEPLEPTRSESTVKALEELGDYTPTYLPEGFEEQGVMGCPLAEGGGWYSYVRKWYVNKAQNIQVYFEYETYAIDSEMGYTDDAKTACSFYIPGSDALNGTFVGEETEVCGMFALRTENHIAWADPENHVAYHLTSEDVLGQELLEIARSIQ